eukprot:scaffold75216_cov28-Tisochrysis_lutea.AAC.2
MTSESTRTTPGTAESEACNPWMSVGPPAGSDCRWSLGPTGSPRTKSSIMSSSSVVRPPSSAPVLSDLDTSEPLGRVLRPAPPLLPPAPFPPLRIIFGIIWCFSAWYTETRSTVPWGCSGEASVLGERIGDAITSSTVGLRFTSGSVHHNMNSASSGWSLASGAGTLRRCRAVSSVMRSIWVPNGWHISRKMTPAA